ncbi:peptide-methionine (R)-S-oxide reductase MsrB [Sphingomicrobium clamense]|uniref:Peptide-methionine (R)-S-oxide reductase MsrB n=1 Tax=Sphingomicrobium clamense TaxID=2851013 RepID=A0ABS6V8H1_9SPHN|nr:peptide-methionine (R)-S-oxide reductase MsrB [Sphingomicrobium sp. B8]MBW0145432.1 peptide-methionine (R)-S-oxide reductase MsrB [Sphingomicrobium sp. B8]
MTQLHRRALLGLLGTGSLAAFALGGKRAEANPHGSHRHPVTLSDAAWQKKLGPKRYRILRKAGTEPPFSHRYNDEKRAGMYHCAGCDTPLFSSRTKYDSRSGWPAFWAAEDGVIHYARDTSMFMTRTEEHCARCGGHLGHVFDDGPQPTGKRHCINGLALKFKPA